MYMPWYSTNVYNNAYLRISCYELCPWWQRSLQEQHKSMMWLTSMMWLCRVDVCTRSHARWGSWYLPMHGLHRLQWSCLQDRLYHPSRNLTNNASSSSATWSQLQRRRVNVSKVEVASFGVPLPSIHVTRRTQNRYAWGFNERSSETLKYPDLHLLNVSWIPSPIRELAEAEAVVDTSYLWVNASERFECALKVTIATDWLHS